jgi:hypothetical protein
MCSSELPGTVAIATIDFAMAQKTGKVWSE